MTKSIATFTLVFALAAPAARGADIVETAVSNGSFKTLAAALDAAGLVDTLKSDGPFTVFAPTDDAFANLPEGTVDSLLRPENKQQLVGILTYHVVADRVPARQVVKLDGATTVNGQRVDISTSDDGVQVDQANVVKTDIACSNGIIHVVDKVLMPASETIPAVASEAGQFNTLLAAVKTAGLAEALSSKGPFTVFAPTDDAFAKLPQGTVDSLLKPENREKLVDILKYHVVPGRIYSDEALSAEHAETLQGGKLRFAAKNDAAYVNKARILKTNIDASNGVIHVIDAVLLPSSDRKQTQSSVKPRSSQCPSTAFTRHHSRPAAVVHYRSR